MQLFSETVRKLWNAWEIRVLVLLSLCLQIVLILLGKRRKYTARAWVRVVLWLAYLSADWVATVALGILCNRRGDKISGSNGALAAFWAPFLLVHLGGPDAITAYSLEDNELWLRHFLGLLVQAGIAFYVFLRSWTSSPAASPLMLLAIPMFVSGIIKYGERTWALYAASYDHFGNYSLPQGYLWQSDVVIASHGLGPKDSGDGIQDLEKSKDRKDIAIEVASADAGGKYPERLADKPDDEAREAAGEDKMYDAAYLYFKSFRILYSDLIFSRDEIRESRRFFLHSSWEDAFKVIELELGFFYDMLFTKASVFCSVTGISLRFISFASTASAFVGFLKIGKQGFSKVDVSISYALMVGAVVLEIYAIVAMLFSVWTIVWLNQKKFKAAVSLCLGIKSVSAAEDNMWSDSMAQFSLIDYCAISKPSKLQDRFNLCNILLQRWHTHHTKVPAYLKEAIFRHVVEMAKSHADAAELCSRRGNGVIGSLGDLLPQVLRESVSEVDFDDSLLRWHVATDVCYHCSDPDDQSDADAIRNPHRKTSKLISDYMFYLQVMRPSMLPKGYGKMRRELAFIQARTFLHDCKIAMSGLTVKGKASKLLKKATRSEDLPRIIGPGILLAEALQSGFQNLDIRLGKWEVICKVWMEMLCFAANQGGWKQHAQQLGRGGELLTHVSLLMAHLGLTDQTRNTTTSQAEGLRKVRAHAQAVLAAIRFRGTLSENNSQQ